MPTAREELNALRARRELNDLRANKASSLSGLRFDDPIADAASTGVDVSAVTPEPVGLSPREELNRLRANKIAREQRFGEQPQQPVSTGAPNVFQETLTAGDPRFVGPIDTSPIIQRRNLPDPLVPGSATDAFLSNALGQATFGAAPTSPGDALASEQHPTAALAGDIAGFFGPLGIYGKLAKGAKYLAPLANPGTIRTLKVAANETLKRLGRGALVGLGIEGTREAVDVAQGREFNLEDIAGEAALFGTIDALFGIGGQAFTRIVQSRNVKKLNKFLDNAIFTEKLKPITAEERAALGEFVRTGKGAKALKDARALKAGENVADQLPANRPPTFGANSNPADAVWHTGPPIVTRGEEKILRSIPEEKVAEGVVGRLGQKVGDAIETGSRLMERMGLKELLLRPVQKAEADAVRVTRTAFKNFDKVVKDKIPLGSRTESSRRIMIFATSQQKNGAEILSQMGVTKIPTLTKNETAVYEFMRNNLDDLFRQVNEARVASGVAPIPRVENYFTFFRNLEGELAKHGDISRIETSQLFAPKAVSKTTPFGFAGARTPTVTDEYGELLLDAFGVYKRYVRSSSKHIKLSPEIAKGRQLLDGKFQSGFKLSEKNPGAHDKLNRWLNFVSGVDEVANVFGDNAFNRGLDRGLRRLNRNQAYSVLSFNIRSAMIQPTAIVNTFVKIGGKHTLSGVKSAFDPRARRFAHMNSNELTGRQSDVALFDAGAGVGGKINTAQQKVGDVGFAPLQTFDMVTAEATWLGSYKRAKEVLKMTHDQAKGWADDVVVATQASAARSNLSPIQRSAMGKSIAAFQTFVINNWGFLTKDVLGIGNPKITNRVAREQVTRYLIGSQLMNAVYEDGFGVTSPFPAPVREFAKARGRGKSVGESAQQAFAEATTVVPIVGGALKWGSSPAGANVQLLTDFAKLYQNFSTKGALKFGGKAFGVPGASQIAKAFRPTNKDLK